MRSFLVVFLLASILPSSLPAQWLGRLDLDEYTFSPNGDGVEDRTTVTLSLADSVDGLLLWLVEDTTGLPVDTLLDRGPSPAETLTVVWEGTRWDGGPAPEGRYRLVARAWRGTTVDSLVRWVRIDLTAPQVSVLSVDPGIFAPDLPDRLPVATVAFQVFHSPPADSDYARVSLFDPEGSLLRELTVVGGFRGDGVYTVQWDGSDGQQDGLYRVEIRVIDAGGNSGSDWIWIDLDKDPPDAGVLGIAPGSRFRIPPDTLRGWAWDRHGVDSLAAAFGSSGYWHLPFRPGAGDTVFFAIPFADSIAAEGDVDVHLVAWDVLGRAKEKLFSFTYDTTAPPPPVWDPPLERRVHLGSIELRGRVPSGAMSVRVFQDGTMIDSIVVLAQTAFSTTASLTAPIHRFTADAVDETGNVSDPSDTLVVIVESGVDVFFERPFRPGGHFEVRLARSARSLDLRIFDLAGDLVRHLTGPEGASEARLPWDGRNESGESVRRGPLILVVDVRYPDGSRERWRKAFLYSP
jgi:hypothetical protein